MKSPPINEEINIPQAEKIPVRRARVSLADRRDEIDRIWGEYEIGMSVIMVVCFFLLPAGIVIYVLTSK